ncbi:MAG: hypothetical protein IKB40_07440 [Paludibacteraceae bacterium]|nr:hypothetical protein [Paludibacteraceae bacterium]
MIRRVLQINRISEEQLKDLLTHVQWLCMKENRYFIITEDIDWLIVIHVLFEQEIIHKGVRPPYTAFENWILSNVTLYHAAPRAEQLSVVARRLADAHHPWQSKKAPQYAVRKWQALYHHLTRLVTQAILLHQ